MAAVPNSATAAPHAALQKLPAGLQPTYISIGNRTNAPIGWIDFCIEYKPECNTRPSTPRDVVLTSKAWADMVKVDLWVNRTIKPMTDMEHWGVVERWNYPSDGYGDCEDYVLLKRRMLMRAGWPREALLITVVRDQHNEGHAVLTVKTNRGEFILDNQTDRVLAWNKTGYTFIKRQSQSDPNEWVSIGAPEAAPPAVAAR
ncbi:MAG TPA: transglutaminase-like cysteine peptidase [Pseudolabrys sp.]|nr:transglutaminase-like cysteine peptidase [Pseudolabrys sp.]